MAVTGSSASAATSAPLPVLNRLRSSLLLRIALLLGALLALLGAALFLSVDHWIAREIESVEQKRVERDALELRERLEAEVRQFRGLASLAASDSDLVHSTQYHVRLAGEAKAAQQDVERIAATLDFPSSALMSIEGQVIASNSEKELAASGFRADWKSGASAAFSSALWHGGSLWVVGLAPVQSEGQVIAMLRVARPATVALRAADGGRAQLEPATHVPGRSSIEVVDQAGRPVHLDVVSDDRSAAILSRAKRTLATIFLLGGVVAGAAMLLLLNIEMKPLRELTNAVAAVGRGDFRQRVRARGAGEIGALTNAFNSMAEDLSRLRGMEQTLREQEKITAIGRLATRLAHDINNPVTVIKNAALLLRQRPDNDSQTRDDLNLIVRHSDRCASILQNLLRFGRPLRVKPETIELAPFCAGVIERARLRQPSGHWVLTRGDEALAVRADSGQLEQMLENLLNNAYEAAPASPIVLSWGHDGDRPYVEVRDKGHGFSTEAKAHLFELFYTTKERGTGLGLANVHAIARAIGAELRIENNEGAVVRILFPRLRAEPAA